MWWSNTWLTLLLTSNAKNNPSTSIKNKVLSLTKNQNVCSFRQVKFNPSLFEFHNTTVFHLARSCCLLARWLYNLLDQIPQIEKFNSVFAILDFDHISLI